MHPELSFDSIESAHEFVALLTKVAFEAKSDIDADIQREISPNASRRVEAMRIVAHKLGTLELHLTKSRRILNDLRSLRRLLFEERSTGIPVVRPRSTGMAKPETAPSSSSESRSGVSPESAAAPKASVCAAVRKRALSAARDPQAFNQEGTDAAPWYTRPDFKATGLKHKATGVL
jgi:hypothetical protein